MKTIGVVIMDSTQYNNELTELLDNKTHKNKSHNEP